MMLPAFMLLRAAFDNEGHDCQAESWLVFFLEFNTVKKPRSRKFEAKMENKWEAFVRFTNFPVEVCPLVQ
jgi:hypothetical protein